jgi:hypothetical protein
MKNLKIRRRRANYFLPSEQVSVLSQLVGKSIKKFELGTRYPSREILIERNSIAEISDLIYKSQGGPFIFSFEEGRTLIFYDDDLLGSLVFRPAAMDSGDPDFLEKLEREDQVGARGSVKSLVDLSIECGFIDKTIEKIAIYRLPVNYLRNPVAYDLLNECVLCFKIRDFGDVLFVCEINENGGPPDIRVSDWNRIEEHIVEHLSCVWSSDID